MHNDFDETIPYSPEELMPGRISIGPIKGVDGKYLLKNLPEYNLYIPRGEGASMNARMTSAGFLVEIEGPGVLGYLVDDEGFQASETDLENFAVKPLEFNDQIVITGDHLVDKDIKVLCKTVIRMRSEGLLRPAPIAEVFVTRVGAGIGVDNLRKG